MDNPDIKEQEENQEDIVSENTEQATVEKPAESNKEQVEIARLKDEIAESKDKYLRLYSEFENFRRRTSKEKLEMIQSAGEQLLKQLVPILDDFERAQKAFALTNTDAEGLLLIQSKFKKILEANGIKIMDVSKGSEFDADLHEAIAQVPAEEDKLQGKVIEVVEKGYLLNDKVIRFAKVVVGS
jgi:molecular chaperone GrpE